ncbi:MAG: ribonuclease HII [DPANN group archaeon]|nr:ribonuclease HII [DPANN group archaeon]
MEKRVESNIIGLDEAGRGPVIGPIVLAGVEIRKEDEAIFKELGIKDSKRLSAKKREELALKIRAIAIKISVIKISAKNLDELMSKKSLNLIELESFVSIINDLSADTVYLDLPERSNRFQSVIKKESNRKIKLIAEHKADDKYPVVSAASIIAKVERDNEIKMIEKNLGFEIGSGYPSDVHTVNFLKKYLETHDTFPDCVRHAWATTKKLLGAKKQKSLFNY